MTRDCLPCSPDERPDRKHRSIVTSQPLWHTLYRGTGTRPSLPIKSRPTWRTWWPWQILTKLSFSPKNWISDMGLNDLMHPTNIYKDSRPVFKKLAVKYLYFRSYLRDNKNGDVTIDIKDPKCLRALTCALLENDLDIRIYISLDRLITTVPLRLNLHPVDRGLDWISV